MENSSYQIDFIKEKLDKPCVLIGTGGAGKTTIGNLVSKELGLDFLDSDTVLETEEGTSISEIFTDKGEAYFRLKERVTIAGIINQSSVCIIGTGGGAFMDHNTRTLILDKTISIFIEAEMPVLLKRVGQGEGRPLFNDKNPEDVLRQMITTRYPIYKLANITIESADEPIEQTAEKVLNSLYNYLSHD